MVRPAQRCMTVQKARMRKTTLQNLLRNPHGYKCEAFSLSSVAGVYASACPGGNGAAGQAWKRSHTGLAPRPATHRLAA